MRAEGRQQEMAIRAALGAGWAWIARESATLGLMGGALGLGFVCGALRLLTVMGPANLPRLDEIAIDPSVLLFACAVSQAAGILFGLAAVLEGRSIPAYAKKAAPPARATNDAWPAAGCWRRKSPSAWCCSSAPA